MYLSTTCIQDKYHFVIFLIFINVSIGLNMEHSKQLKSGTSITITTGCLSYSSYYLKSFKEAMGIQKHPRLYRRLRAGVNLFHKIKTVISRLSKQYRPAKMNSASGNTNTITIQVGPT